MFRVAVIAAMSLVAGIALGIAGQEAQVSWDSDQATRDRTIARAPSQTEATLTAVEIDDDEHRNPNCLHYEFVVNGVNYMGADYSGEGGNPPYNQLHPGDVVHAIYYRPNPHVSCACDPTGDLSKLQQIELSFGIATGAVGAFAIAFLTAIGLYLRHRTRHNLPSA